jgi:xanthine/uracil/vitamin C permease (AzgA family)
VNGNDPIGRYMLDKLFKLGDHDTNTSRETAAGITTFLTMAQAMD